MRRELCLALLACGLVTGQQANDKKQAPPKEASQTSAPKEAAPKKEPIPLFSGKIGATSSQKTKESATLGFNGIDPSGKVDAKMLVTPATAEHEAKVRKLAEMAPAPAELDAFIREGGLKKL